MDNSKVRETLDHLFRRESTRAVAHLTRFLGTENLDLAEAVVQDALVRAIQTWPLRGIPDNPAAWIQRVAKNAAIDALRSGKFLTFDNESAEQLLRAESEDFLYEAELRDDQLRLMFICCHPSISEESRVALTLKTVCGFSVAEIARAFLCKEETVAQRLVRAKRFIAENRLPFEVPPPEELNSRLRSVTEVIYLMFNEGYAATQGDFLIRRDLCEEAIHRATALLECPTCQRPEVFALLALMHLQISRFDARIDGQGELLLLEEQDRTLWDQQHIGLGLHFLECSAEGEELSAYHLQAGIASCHATAVDFAATDWGRILTYYDLLLADRPASLIALNRAVALAMLEGPEAGLKAISEIESSGTLHSYYLLHASKAELLRRAARHKEATIAYQTALGLTRTEPERRLLKKRIEQCLLETS